MKKLLRSFVVCICLFTSINLFTPSNIEAKTSSEKKNLISIIRTVENGKCYIIVLLDNWIISKVEEL